MRRMLAAEAGVSLDSMLTDTMGHDDWDKLAVAAEILKQRSIFIVDNSMLTTLKFRKYCQEFKKKHPDLGLVAVDYLQHMMWDGKSENRNH